MAEIFDVKQTSEKYGGNEPRWTDVLERKLKGKS
jgi:hypothetical protein